MSLSGKRFASLVVFMALTVSSALASQMVVRVYADDYWLLYDHIQFKGTSIEIAGTRPGESYDLLVGPEDLDLVQSCGLRTEVTVHDLAAARQAALLSGRYHSYEELTDMMRGWASGYPSICSLDSIGPTYEGRWIYGVRIGTDTGADKPEVLVVGVHHAREWAAAEVPRYIADTLLSNYATNSEFRDFIDNHQLWVFPVVNPDGYCYDYPGQEWWRKNRQPFDSKIGCDPNRDYNGTCTGSRMGDWGSLVYGSSTTHNPRELTFFGASGAWGKEIGALSEFFKQHTFVACMSYHSYSELVLWPYGHGESTADSTYYEELGQQIAGRIAKLSGGTYEPMRGDHLYPTNCGSDDWMYGWGRTIGGFPCMSFTNELGTEFYQPESDLDAIQTEAFKGVWYLMQQADAITEDLEGTVPRPILAQMDSSSTGSYTIHWTPVNPEHNHPTKWELEELAGLSVVEDSMESGADRWELVDVQLSSTEKHSGNYSVYLGTGNNTSNYMVTKDPYPVQSGDSLTYWIWYYTENRFDVVTTEVSLEGKEWFQLHDRYTGNSSGWVREAYSLEPWVGKSVFIRFRYMTDNLALFPGVYVDDVWPVPAFADRSVVSSEIGDTLYSVSDATLGRHFYRVRGYNEAWAWGDQGPLEDILVTGTGVAEGPASGLETGIAGIGPNPSNGRLVIRYAVGRDGAVAVSVYDAAGREIRELVSDSHKQGIHEVLWDGRDRLNREVPSGVYYCRVLADRAAVSRITLIR